MELAKRRESHIYPMHELSSGRYIASRGTIHKTKRKLLAAKLIELTKTEIHAGRERKIYTLTLNGVLVALGNVFVSFKPFVLKEVDLVVTNYQHLLPLFFGKWKFFKEQGLEKWAHHELWRIVQSPFYQRHTMIISPEEFKKEIKDYLKKMVFNISFYPPQAKEAPVFQEQIEDFKKLKRDPEIAALINRRIKEYAAEIEGYYEGSKWWLKWWTTSGLNKGKGGGKT